MNRSLITDVGNCTELILRRSQMPKVPESNKSSKPVSKSHLASFISYDGKCFICISSLPSHLSLMFFSIVFFKACHCALSNQKKIDRLIFQPRDKLSG